MQISRRVLVAAAFIAAFAIPLRADDIDDWVKAQMKERRIPAVSIAVIKGGKLVKAEGYGIANLEHNIPATSSTVYKIGSVSKQFIAAGVMLLVQDGKVVLDQPLSRYVAGTPDAWQAITIRHLLTHTSGLVREAPGFDPYKIQPDNDVIRTAFPIPLNSKPGDKYAYSNLGYYTLAEVIHSVSGRSWAEFLNERVFDPAGNDFDAAHERGHHHPEQGGWLRVEQGSIREHGKLDHGSPERGIRLDGPRHGEVGSGAAVGSNPDRVNEEGDVDAGQAQRWQRLSVWVWLGGRSFPERRRTDGCPNDSARRIHPGVPRSLLAAAKTGHHRHRFVQPRGRGPRQSHGRHRRPLCSGSPAGVP
jgi:CubicO group peptidase (beta-lactamase class C family)